jgi:hypothetical protein
MTTVVPPRPGPIAPGNHLRFSAHFMVEAWDGCFDVDSLLHTLCYLCVSKKKESEPNARGEPRPEAGARNERTLWGVGSSAMFK